jgi:phosphatidylinositol alpha-1,6-mannosyltransferase
MRALLLAHDFPPLGGGISRWMAELARRWPASDLVVSAAAAPGGSDAAFPAEIDRVPVPADRLRTFAGIARWSRRAGSLVDRHRPGIVWCDTFRPTAYVARWLRATRRVPVGVFVHGGDVQRIAERSRRSVAKSGLGRLLAGTPDLLVANSRWTAGAARAMAAQLGRPDLRIEIVPLGSDPARFGPDGPRWAGAARLPPGRRILTVARLVPHKGIDRGIETVARLRDRFPDLRYLVAGEGPDRARLERIAAEAGVADRVDFLGPVSEADLPGVYRTADLYLGLSREDGPDVEGFGIAVADGSASGLPVVATQSGGIPETVEDGVTGLLVDPEAADGAVAAVSRILEDSELGSALGRAGRRLVETRLNWDRVAADLLRLSREAAAARR